VTAATTVVLVAGLYLVACLAIGMLSGRKSSDSATGYVAGDRALGLVVMYFVTGATIFSAFAFLGAPGWAYSRGVAPLYIIAYGTLGFMPFYFIGPKAAELGRRHGFVTQAEMVAHRFGMPSLAGLMALISLVAFVPYLALQMQGAGLVIESMTRGAVPSWVGALIVYAVVTAYVVKSGVLGVGWTNVFQGVFMMILAWVLGLWLPKELYGGIGPMFERIAAERPEMLVPPGLAKGGGGPWSWQAWSSFGVVSIIGFSCWPHLFMKAFGAKDGRTIRRTVVLYPTFQIFLVPILLIGFAGILFEPAPAEANQILPHLLMHMELPAVLVGLFCAGALAASMSSGDAIVHAAASILVRDGWMTALGKRLSPERERTVIRWLVPAVMIVSYVIAVLYSGSLVRLLAYAYGPVTQFAPGIVATLYWRRATGVAVFAGMLVGIAVDLALIAQPDWSPFGVHEGLYAVAANALVLVAVSLANPRAARVA
jgi:SSS family solute:Na+ symporter